MSVNRSSFMASILISVMDLIGVRQAGQEAIRRRAGKESKLYWQVKEESEPRNKLILIDLVSKLMGDPRGYTPLVTGQSPRRGGRERSERWKGEVSSPSKDSMGKISGLKNQPA